MRIVIQCTVYDDDINNPGSTEITLKNLSDDIDALSIGANTIDALVFSAIEKHKIQIDNKTSSKQEEEDDLPF